MNKKFALNLFAVIALITSLCSCSLTAEKAESHNSDIQNSFSNSIDSSEGEISENSSESETDDYMEQFGKYQQGGMSVVSSEITGQISTDEIEYSGGEITYSFEVNTKNNAYDVEFGFMAFINGIPQQVSINNSEKSEMAKITLAPSDSTALKLCFTPFITEELAKEDKLRLSVFAVFNPSFVPTGKFLGFANAHKGQGFAAYDVLLKNGIEEKAEKPKAVKDAESLLFSDEVGKKYGFQKLPTNTMVYIKNKDTDKKHLNADESGSLSANLFFSGSEAYTYNIYVYVNHKRVKFGDGYDCITLKNKSGYLNVYPLDLSGINDRDFIYAIAVPVDNDAGILAAVKSQSELVVNEA